MVTTKWTTKQQGDPSASLLLTSEKEVFCNSNTWTQSCLLKRIMSLSALKCGLWTQENTIVSISILLFIGIALDKQAGSCIVICPTRSSLYWPMAICDDHLYFNIQRIERYNIEMYVLAPVVHLLELKSTTYIIFSASGPPCWLWPGPPWIQNDSHR